MGVLLIDSPEETLLDVRLTNSVRDANELEDTLRHTYYSAPVGFVRYEVACLLETVHDIQKRLAELISTRGK